VTGGIGFCAAVLFGAAIGGREEFKRTVLLLEDAKIRETALCSEEEASLDSPLDSMPEASDASEEAAFAELVEKVLEAAEALEAAELTVETGDGADCAGGL